MAVGVNGKKRIFTIRTKQTTYQMMADAHGVLLHLYYGPRAEGAGWLRMIGFGTPSACGGGGEGTPPPGFGCFFFSPTPPAF